MINGNGGKCKSTANKYALSAIDLPLRNLALMEGGNTLDALIWETLESFKLDYGT